MSAPQRILVVNPFGIGDVLFTTPLIRALRRAFPESRLSYLCNRRTERILQNNPNLDGLFVYEKDELVELLRASRWRGLGQMARMLNEVRRSRFDLVIDLSLGERYGLIMKLLGIPRRIGFNYRNRGRFLTEHMTIDGYHDVHVVEYYRRLLRFVGIDLIDDSLERSVAEEDERWAEAWIAQHQLKGHLIIGMVPAGGVSWGIDAPFRRWNFEGFAAVGDALAEQYHARLLLFGENADRPLCQAVADKMTHSPIDLSGQTTLGQFVSLLGRVGLVICNDGGPLHLAVSQRVRTVSIFGPVDPRVYGPYGPSTHHQVVTRELPCRPCYRQFRLPPCPYNRACLNEVSIDQVLSAAHEVLKAR